METNKSKFVYTRDLPSFQGDKQRFQIGEHSYGIPDIIGLHLLDKLVIGKFCAIGAGVRFLISGHHHNPQWITTYPFLAAPLLKTWGNPQIETTTEERTLHIGNDVWLGDGSVLFSDIHIGDGAVIGTRTIVRRDVPPYAIMKGNPAQISRYRFSRPDIEFLLKLKWWDKPKEWIEKALPVLLSNDIDKLRSLAD